MVNLTNNLNIMLGMLFKVHFNQNLKKKNKKKEEEEHIKG